MKAAPFIIAILAEGNFNMVYKLPKNGSGELLHIAILSNHCNKLFYIDFLLFLLPDFLSKRFDNIRKVHLFQLIVMGQLDKTLIGKFTRNIILIQPLYDNIQLGNPLL